MIYDGIGHELTGAEDRAAADTAQWLSGIGLGVKPRVRTRLVDVRVGAKGAPVASMQAGLVHEPVAGHGPAAPAVLLLYDRGQDVLTNPTEWLGDRGRRPVVVAGHGWGGERAAGFLQRHPQSNVRGLVLRVPPPDGENVLWWSVEELYLHTPVETVVPLGRPMNVGAFRGLGGTGPDNRHRFREAGVLLDFATTAPAPRAPIVARFRQRPPARA